MDTNSIDKWIAIFSEVQTRLVKYHFSVKRIASYTYLGFTLRPKSLDIKTITSTCLSPSNSLSKEKARRKSIFARVRDFFTFLERQDRFVSKTAIAEALTMDTTCIDNWIAIFTELQTWLVKYSFSILRISSQTYLRLELRQSFE